MTKIQISERSILQEDTINSNSVGYDLKDYVTSFSGLSGQCIRLRVREGFDLSAFDIEMNEENHAPHTMTQPCVGIYIMLNGAGHGEVYPNKDKAPLSMPYIAGKTYISILNKPMRGRSITPANIQFQGIDLRFSWGFLKKLKLTTLFSTLDAQHPAHICSDEHVWIGQLNNSRNIDVSTRQILNIAFTSADDIRLESIALGILSSSLDKLTQHPPQQIERPLTQKEHRNIIQATALIHNDLAHHWTIDELSRQVGLNNKRLKIGFKSINGAPIGRYIQQQRLSKAKTLIHQQGMNITEASLNVGYANPSHFAYLFKREFGYKPSTIK